MVNKGVGAKCTLPALPQVDDKLMEAMLDLRATRPEQSNNCQESSKLVISALTLGP